MEQKFVELNNIWTKKFSQQDGQLKEMCSALIDNFAKEVKSETKNQLDEQNDKENQTNMLEGSVFEQMESPQKKKKQAKMFYES